MPVRSEEEKFLVEMMEKRVGERNSFIRRLLLEWKIRFKQGRRD